MENCLTCAPALPVDQLLEAAIKKATNESKEFNAPIAVYQEGESYQTRNAFEAFEAGFGPVVRTVISAHNGTATM